MRVRLEGLEVGWVHHLVTGEYVAYPHGGEPSYYGRRCDAIRYVRSHFRFS